MIRQLFYFQLMLLISATAYADHSWNDYHWARTHNPIALQVVNSVTSDWEGQLVDAISQWSHSNIINLEITLSDIAANVRNQCPIVEGKLHVCNAKYGKNGWLGQTIIGFDVNGHIDKARARLNDSYFKQWTLERKNHVMCHEIGHVFGLWHTSQDGSSQHSCLDLSKDPLSQWPNQHDYAQLRTEYQHKDSYNSYDDASQANSTAQCDPQQDPGCANGNFTEPSLGILVGRGKYHETWVTSRKDGGYWVRHVLLAGDE